MDRSDIKRYPLIDFSFEKKSATHCTISTIEKKISTNITKHISRWTSARARAAAPPFRERWLHLPRASCRFESRACGSAPITLNYHRDDHYWRSWMTIERDDNEDDFEPARFHGEVRRLDLDKRARIHKRKKERNRRLPSPLSASFLRALLSSWSAWALWTAKAMR